MPALRHDGKTERAVDHGQKSDNAPRSGIWRQMDAPSTLRRFVDSETTVRKPHAPASRYALSTDKVVDHEQFPVHSMRKSNDMPVSLTGLTITSKIRRTLRTTG